MEYLRPKQHYIDLYDLHTIEECLDYYWGLKDRFEKNRNSKDFKKYSRKDFDHEVHKVVSITINVIKGERHRHKADRIQEWMDRDRERQEFYDNTSAPSVSCPSCSQPMISESKLFSESFNKPFKMLFIMECSSCNKRLGVDQDGKERVSRPYLCPKCDQEAEYTSKDEGEVTKWITKCSSCGYTNTEVKDWKKDELEREKEKKREEMLLKKYRSVFTYSDEEGKDYLRGYEKLKHFHKMLEEKEKKDADPAYRKARKLKKLKVSELEQMLSKVLEKEKYVKLSLDKPEMGRHVIIPFTAQDIDSKREEYDSKTQLRRLMKKTLEKTNWRLMSEGVDYRLGILSGRLKAYENENDLAELMRRKNV